MKKRQKTIENKRKKWYYVIEIVKYFKWNDTQVAEEDALLRH